MRGSLYWGHPECMTGPADRGVLGGDLLGTDVLAGPDHLHLPEAETVPSC